MNTFSHSTGENRTLRFAFTSDEAKKTAQSETQAYLDSIAPKAVPTAQTGASPAYSTVDLNSRTYSTTPMSTSYTNTTGKLTPDNSTYGTPISTAPTTFTKPAFTNLAEAQKAQQEYYLKNGSTSASIAADITNLGGGSGDFNQVDPYKLQTPVASQPTIVNDPQRDIKVPGTGTFTVASAKYDLATSRDPRVKTAAQEFLNAEQNKVKGYVDRSWTDPETGATYVTKSEDPKATEQAQQQWLATQAQDQANRLKSQEQADKLKKFVSGIDTSALDQTTKQMNDLLGSIKNLSPDLQASVLPQLLQLQQSNNEVTKMAQEMITAQPTDEQITANYGTLEKYIESQDTKFKDILAKNLETSKEIAQYHKDSLEIDKKIIEHDAAVAEQKQIAANTQNEKQLRRQLNRLGLQTDTSGLDYLQTEIQKGATALEELKTGNNLVMLKANLAIGEGYRLEVKQAMETYEGNYLNITSQTTEKLQSIKNSISSAKSDRAKNIIEAKKWELEQKQENDKEARKTISDAQKTMADAIAAKAKSDKDGSMSTKDKLGFVSSLRTGINQNKTITQANDADGFYGALNSAYDYYETQLSDPNLSNESRNAAQTAVIGSFARMLDPNSVVRNEEYERQVYGQAFTNTVKGYWDKVSTGGSGMTQSDIKAMKKVADQIHSSWESRLQTNMQPFILDIQDWNKNYPDSQIDFAQVIPVDRIHLPTQTMSTWASQTGWQSGTQSDPVAGFATGGAPSNGWRTDRNNNPIAFAVKAGQTNEFTDALDAKGIAWEHGSPFPDNPNMVTVKVIGDPVEGARAVLSDSKALQNWYLGEKRPYAPQLAKFGIRNNEDFKALPKQKQNEIIVAIYKGEVGNGSLVASILPSNTKTDPSGDNPFIPKAVAAEYDDIHFNDVPESSFTLFVDDPSLLPAKKTAKQKFLESKQFLNS